MALRNSLTNPSLLPSGPTNDWGIKYNISNGAPAPESLTDVVYKYTQSVAEYFVADIPAVNLHTRGTTSLGHDGEFEVEVVDSAAEYLDMEREVFDFDAIGEFVRRPDFTMLADSLHGGTVQSLTCPTHM